ncbi:MAG: SIS domain-containing protein [Acidobacteria bacterium]|nr:SIS domain-containing protein [Acidobacteriota bacterium]
MREILQQPLLWPDSAERAIAQAGRLRQALDGVKTVVLTGSGSSVYAAECLALAIQSELGISASAIAGGQLVMHAHEGLPPERPALMVSLARSGDSPESYGALELFLAADQNVRHLVVTCNSSGRLRRSAEAHPLTACIELDPRTCDHSLVMTSSFTDMVVAARFLGMLDRAEEYRKMAARLAEAGRFLLLKYPEAIAAAARCDFASGVFLGSGCRFGAAREAALKMQEMAAGRVFTFAETYLGLRHGPMASVHENTLIVCFLSSDPLRRAYESDLISELNRKRLGRLKVIVGEQIPSSLLRDGDLAIDIPGLAGIGDDNVPVIDVMAAQLLAFFRCRAEGLNPDAPSAGGVISRVVGEFTIHTLSRGGQ